MKIKIILSTTRPGKASDKVGAWALQELRKLDDSNSYEILDLAKINLPFFDETSSPRNKTYKNDHTIKWSKTIEEADGFIIVLAEYNGAYPAPLKNAIDYLYWEWVDKPVGIIGYGSTGATTSIESLTPILRRLKMKVLNHKVLVNKIWSAFDDNGNIDQSLVEGSFEKLLDELNNT
jgi:NAD(P)H-dependent FMN reductase